MLFENVSDNHEDDFRNKNNLEADNLSSEEKVSSKSYNFDSIKSINSDVIGWIKIDGTKVNYPVMQNSNDSNYYLHRNINKSYSSIGSIYVPNIFFDWKDKDTGLRDEVSDHVGIVKGFDKDNNQVYTIEGNTSNSCAYRDYDANSEDILGYGRPNYSDVVANYNYEEVIRQEVQNY